MFPDNFLFGSNVSDYQHFGGSECDLPKIYSVNHKKFYASDFQFIDKVGLSAFRFNIEWARIEPKENFVDKNAIDFYHNYFSELKKHNVKTFVTLHHFTNPGWIHGYGGFASQHIKDKFLDYVNLASKEFGNEVDYFIVFNEPMLYLYNSLIAAKLPPYGRDRFLEMEKAMKNVSQIHSDAYEIIKNNSHASIGSVNAVSAIETGAFLKSFQEFIVRFNDRFLENVSKSMDFIGINYYVSYKNVFKKEYVTDPENLRHVLSNLYKKCGKPLFVTENGISTSDDSIKSSYLIEHIKSVEDAIEKDNVDVRGYFNWSFLHGYEWFNGFKPNFSIIDVDLDTMGRRLTKTGEIYSQIINKKTAKNFILSDEAGFRLRNFNDWPFDNKVIPFDTNKNSAQNGKDVGTLSHYLKFLRRGNQSKAKNRR
jgi:beta-glucosidase